MVGVRVEGGMAARQRPETPRREDVRFRAGRRRPPARLPPARPTTATSPLRSGAAHGTVALLQRDYVRHEHPADPLSQLERPPIPCRIAAQARHGPQRDEGHRLAVRVGERGRGVGAVLPQEARPERLQRVDGVAPALLREAPGRRAEPMTNESFAPLQRSPEPRGRRAPLRLERAGELLVLERREQRPATTRSRPPCRSTRSSRSARGGTRPPRTAPEPRLGTRGRSCPAPPRSRVRRWSPDARRGRATPRARHRVARGAPATT